MIKKFLFPGKFDSRGNKKEQDFQKKMSLLLINHHLAPSLFDLSMVKNSVQLSKKKDHGFEFFSNF